jgi:hypothetical protein
MVLFGPHAIVKIRTSADNALSEMLQDQFRNALIRVYRLKNLRWSLYHVDREGNRARMPQLMQILEDETEYVLVVEDQRRKRPNAPGTSKRRHFERANQKRGRRDFEWHPPQEQSSHKNHPPGSEKNLSRGHQNEVNSERFTWTAPDTEPHVEPPGPEGWKPLVLEPQRVKLSAESVRKLADKRLGEWSKDQEEYTEQKFQEIERKKKELKAQAPEAKKAEIERQKQGAREKAEAEQAMKEKAVKAEIRKREEFEAKEKMRQMYRDQIWECRTTLKSIEDELEQPSNGLGYKEKHEYLERRKALNEEQKDVEQEIDKPCKMMQDSIEMKLTTLKMKWRKEDEEGGE